MQRVWAILGTQSKISHYYSPNGVPQEAGPPVASRGPFRELEKGAPSGQTWVAGGAWLGSGLRVSGRQAANLMLNSWAGYQHVSQRASLQGSSGELLGKVFARRIFCVGAGAPTALFPCSVCATFLYVSKFMWCAARIFKTCDS